MPRLKRAAIDYMASVCLLLARSCGGALSGTLSYAGQSTDPLEDYSLTGEINPVLDPSIIRKARRIICSARILMDSLALVTFRLTARKTGSVGPYVVASSQTRYRRGFQRKYPDSKDSRRPTFLF